MLIAVLLGVIGILSVIILTQFYGYRLGGVIVVPVLAVYTCKNFLMLPLFFAGAIIAYVGLRYLQKKTMIYGRDELVATLLLGSVLPVIALFFMKGVGYDLTDVVFFGSILPGLAAYNYSRIKPEYRLHDAMASVGIFIGLVAAAWFLVTPAISDAIGMLTPAILFSPTSDLALLKNAAVDTYPAPAIIDRFSAFILFMVSLILSEFVRKVSGIRVGVVSMAILAIFSIENKWFFALYFINLFASFIGISLIQKATLIYGRNLIGLGTCISLLLTIPLVFIFPVSRGLSIFFLGLIAGLNAYNLHVTPPAERKLFVPLQLSLLAPLIVLARALGEGQPQGLFHEFGLVQLLVVVLGAAISIAFVKYNWVRKPLDEHVWNASLFSEEDE
ncbi:poly-gamma-glutamate biosynthesis protein PgsC/CapC [Methanococcoides orientis]|uniref:poly-gamma-glutamate biosynthesis protein PgsC/CapC n=1 Tax=Methanococcoides orientis TaxID=2822137 RepID=UPI001E6358AE|nr:poly-gamma-glutamate biosynthesis protein PgsC/CapC [Methanococcoides orientis]UGV40261.1 poly-gamma-glutamate biosynthesis protein PgsC/CapC [Methanococcoides orientis]